MKLYSKLALFIACAMAFAACSSDDDFKAGEWDGRANDAQVYFAADSISFSEILDPSDPTTKTFNVHRKDSVGALTVKFTAVENTDNVFTVSDAEFADGQRDATFTIKFDSADVDKTYKLLLKAEGYNSSYASESVLFAYSFLIEKWNDLGIGLYTDDIVAPLYGGEPISYEVKVIEKDSKPGLYRVIYPYGENYPYNEPGQWDDSKDYNLEIDATDPTSVFFLIQELGIDWGYGMISAVSNAARYLAAGYSVKETKENGIEFGTLEDGIITFPVQGIVYFDNDGGIYTNRNGAFKLILPAKYATMEQE